MCELKFGAMNTQEGEKAAVVIMVKIWKDLVATTMEKESSQGGNKGW